MELKLISLFLVLGASVVLGANNTTTQVPTTGAMTELHTVVTTIIMPTTAEQSTKGPTTAAPEPPATGHFVVYDANTTKACILENITANFVITYSTINQTQKSITFMLPENSKVVPSESMCGNTTQEAVMVLTWGPVDENNRYVQRFNLTTNTSRLAEIALNINHTAAVFPDSDQQKKVVNYTTASLPDTTFKTDSTHSFSCVSEEYFTIDQNSNVTFSKVRVQALGVAQSVFSEESPCPGDLVTTTAAPTTELQTTDILTTLQPNVTDEGHWTVEGKNGTCIRVNMTMYFIINYNTSKDVVSSANVALPVDADSSMSTCSNTSAKFVLTFPGMDSSWNAADAGVWTLVMDFVMKDNEYHNTNLSLSYIFDGNFDDPKRINQSAEASSNDTGIEADAKQYYVCNSNISITSNEGTGPVKFNMSGTAIQPFATNITTNYGFGEAAPCEADDDFNNIVPIAVGCALAGLVIIVLIAYLIGRQRSSKTGYESV